MSDRLSLSPEPDHLTEVEEEIMKQLDEDAQDLFRTSRDDTKTFSSVLACAKIVLHNYTLTSEMNLVEPLKGQLTLQDYGIISRELKIEREIPQMMSIDGLRYCLGKVCDRQMYFRRPDTYVLDINWCDMQKNGELNPETFKVALHGSKTHEMFSKKWIIFPFWMVHEGFVTVIENPFTVNNMDDAADLKGEKSTILHIGTGTKMEMDSYTNLVVPRIMKAMQLFKNLACPPLTVINCLNDPDVKTKTMDSEVPHCEKPFQFLYILDNLIGQNFHIDEWRQMIDTLGSDKEKMLAEMKYIRRWLSLNVYDAVKGETDNQVAQYLFAMRRRIITSEKERIANGAESDDENPTLKRQATHDDGEVKHEVKEEDDDDDDDVQILENEPGPSTSCPRPPKRSRPLIN